jgi:signal transduction histidine kinase
MERILEISRDLASTVSLEPLLHRIVAAAADLTDSETAAILLVDEQDEGTLRFVAASSLADQLYDIPVPVDASIAGAAFASGEAVIVPDVRADPRYYPEVERLIDYKARSLLAVPLQFHDHRIGVLEAENKRHGEFNQEDVETLTTLAAQATVAIENARLVEALQRARDGLEQRVAERTAELSTANEELKQFAYIVSHDLRAPLVNLKGFAAELDSAMQVVRPALDTVLPQLDEKQRQAVVTALRADIPEALDFIGSSVVRMDHFVNALLKLSRLGRRELKPEPVDMNALVQVTLKAMAHQIEERQVQVTVQPLPEVVADQTSMEQIVGNLLDNAVKYLDSDRSGEIEIAAERGRGETTFHIRDNGCGIAQDDRDKVFAPFRRAGRHAERVAGEGMGLPYVQALVRRHDGRIWFESEAGVGTTFSFTISNHLMEEDERD